MMARARHQSVTDHQIFECDTPARNAAFNRAYGDPAYFGGFFIGKPTGADEDERFTLRRGQMLQRAFDVAQFDLPILPSWCRQ